MRKVKDRILSLFELKQLKYEQQQKSSEKPRFRIPIGRDMLVNFKQHQLRSGNADQKTLIYEFHRLIQILSKLFTSHS
jgi:hypothetical protein